MRDLLRSALDEATLGTPVAELLDFWHVLEKLGAAAQVVYGPTHAPAILGQWRRGLLRRRAAVDDVLTALLASGKRAVRISPTRPVHEAITYLENHRERMDSPRARRDAAPDRERQHRSDVQDPRHGADETERRPLEGNDRVGCDPPAGAGAQYRWDPALCLTLAPLRKAVRMAA